jgi:hypothetical protein
MYMKHIKKFISLLLTCTTLLVGAVVPVSADDTIDHTGWTAISNANQLAEIKTNDSKVKYYLTNDIDLSGYGNFTPIGSENNPFEGTFDGSGYAIKNMNISGGSDCQALFASAASATIENLTIKDSSITATGHYVSAVVAHVGAASLTIKNCHVVNTTITGNCGVGGLIGDIATVNPTYDINVSQSSIKGGSVYSTTYGSGGIVGQIQSGGKLTVSESFCAADSVTAAAYGGAGGIVGVAKGQTEVSNCYNLADISCISAPNNSASNYYGAAGGIIGMSYHADNEANYCYNLGTVKGAAGSKSYSSYAGGIAGYTSGLSSKSCYNRGTVTSANTDRSTKSFAYIGPIHGYGAGTVTSCYYLQGCLATGQFSSRDNGNSRDDDTAMVTSIENNIFDSTIWEFHGGETYPTLKNNPVTVASSEPVTQEYTVTFDSGSAYKAEFAKVADKTVTAADGESGTITLPEAPANTGEWKYDFKGWSDGDIVYKTGDEITVTKDVELTAVWQLHSVNGDKDWDYEDAMAIMDYVAGKTTFCKEQSAVADYNNDGTIDYKDAMKIMDVQAGK